VVYLAGAGRQEELGQAILDPLGTEMSTYVLMKILESASSRYDRGIRLLTLGRLDKVYDRLASYIKDGQRVLDIGCGTGALTFRAVQKGARVKGIDVNPQMLEIAQKRAVQAGFAQNVELVEMGVAELEAEEAESYDVVMSGLCFSELTEDELTYTLKEVVRVLKPEGLLLVADEARSGSALMMVLNWIMRLPLVIITYAITQTTTSAVKDLPDKVQTAGLSVKSIRLSKMQNFIELVAMRPEEQTK
jgi:demethylmenaquinone methyltransferase/2-methoxy-6-polyprenyl-1,4-benzoquinol methylase